MNLDRDKGLHGENPFDLVQDQAVARTLFTKGGGQFSPEISGTRRRSPRNYLASLGRLGRISMLSILRRLLLAH